MRREVGGENDPPFGRGELRPASSPRADGPRWPCWPRGTLANDRLRGSPSRALRRRSLLRLTLRRPLGDDLIDESKFFDRRGREHEGVSVRLAHAAIQIIQHISEREPAAPSGRRTRTRCAWPTWRRSGVIAGSPGRLGLREEAACHGRFQGIDDVKVVRPRLGPVTSQEMGGFAYAETNESLQLPGGRLLMVSLESLGVVGAARLRTERGSRRDARNP